MRAVYVTAIYISVALVCVCPGAGNGLVRFRGMVKADERHNVLPICYGDYFVPVVIGQVLEDPNQVLRGVGQVEVCYKGPAGLTFGDCVEVRGLYYGGGLCPKQYCGRVIITDKEHHITKIGYCCPDGDWLVSDPNISAIPSGNVGIGTFRPQAKLHVVGEVMIESSGTTFRPPLTVAHEGEGRQLAAYLTNPHDGSAEVELQLAGGKMLPWGWSLKAASGLFTLGSVMVAPPALNITSTGNLGLGVTNPGYRLDLPNVAGPSGRGRANAWTTYSSIRFKDNLRPIQDAMGIVRRLRGLRFQWRQDGRPDIGLVAEEVGQVVPEAVDYEPDSNDPSCVDYGRLVAILIEALKQQEARINKLQEALEEMRAELASLRSFQRERDGLDISKR